MKGSQATGKRIEELLFKNNKTQYRLTKDTCLNEKTLRDLIRGRTSDVKLSTIILIASNLNISLKEFFDSPLFDNLED